jgi:hypothetical protein
MCPPSHSAAGGISAASRRQLGVLASAAAVDIGIHPVLLPSEGWHSPLRLPAVSRSPQRVRSMQSMQSCPWEGSRAKWAGGLACS